jgi:hypothetical protein
MVVIPLALGVNVTEQLPAERAHDPELKLPAAPELEKVTVPVGVVIVPDEVSLTVAVHAEAVLTTNGATQDTTVAVLLRLTVTEAVPLLPLWLESPA